MDQDDRIAVVDVETTGLFPSMNDRVVEIAIVIISTDGTIHREYESLVNPERDMGPTRIHQISAAETRRAPKFEQIAGDIVDLLQRATVIAGHNISFDRRFLIGEYARLGVSLPDFKRFCTYHALGRNLEACCREFGIPGAGELHHAICDARATAKLIHVLAEQDPDSFEHFDGTESDGWPLLPKLGTLPITRVKAQEYLNEPPDFMRRIVAKVRHDVEGTQSDVLAYLALIDRVLEDRIIDIDESNTLVRAATEWNLAPGQVHQAHLSYLHHLAVTALADGILTDAERNDLYNVAQLLGQNRSELNALLDSTAERLRTITTVAPSSHELTGKTVCFTGELRSRMVDGESVTRDIAEMLAEKAGLIVASAVTKKLDLLVVADPNTQSGKAKKARLYGTRVMAESVFWRLIGINPEETRAVGAQLS